MGALSRARPEPRLTRAPTRPAPLQATLLGPPDWGPMVDRGADFQPSLYQFHQVPGFYSLKVAWAECRLLWVRGELWLGEEELLSTRFELLRYVHMWEPKYRACRYATGDWGPRACLALSCALPLAACARRQRPRQRGSPIRRVGLYNLPRFACPTPLVHFV